MGDNADGLGEFQQTMLNLINEARSQDRFCGESFRRAADPVAWDERLEMACVRHSMDMADNIHDLDHIGSDGSTFADRIRDEGYMSGGSGENIAAGPRTPEAVVNLWLNSPSHCRNIMAPSHEDLGVATAVGFFNQTGRDTTFWCLLLGRET